MLNIIYPMLQVFIVPGKKYELKIDSKKSVAEILSSLNIEFRSSQGLCLNGEPIDPENFDKVYPIDGLIIISSGAKGEAPTSEVRAVLKWLRRQGYNLVPGGGKGDHMKCRNTTGHTITINRHNTDKKCICWGSHKSLASAFNMTPMEFYDLLKTV